MGYHTNQAETAGGSQQKFFVLRTNFLKVAMRVDILDTAYEIAESLGLDSSTMTGNI